MASLELVRGGGRALARRLDRVPAEALLAGLRAAGAVSEPEAAALGPPGSSGWARRLLALAVARGDRSCRALLTLLERLEGPPAPGPFDFYDPRRDAEPSHRSDCPCCRPHSGHPSERPREGEEGAGHENEEENPENGEENAENGEENPENEEKTPEDEEGEAENGAEGPEDEDGGGDEGPEGEEEEGEAENEEETPEDEDGGGGDEGPEDEEGDGGGDED